jgi:hypothetical protein
MASSSFWFRSCKGSSAHSSLVTSPAYPYPGEVLDLLFCNMLVTYGGVCWLRCFLVGYGGCCMDMKSAWLKWLFIISDASGCFISLVSMAYDVDLPYSGQFGLCWDVSFVPRFWVVASSFFWF